ncbi:rod shape-determining protein MreC [Jatrophihabitans sp. DSM 45814]
MRRLTRRQTIGAAILTAVALLFISLDFAGGSLGGSRTGTTGALGSLYRGTDSVIGPVRRFIQGIPDVGSDRTEIAKLKQQNTDLRRQVAAQSVDGATARRLQTLQLQADAAGWSVMPARVIATGPGAGFEWTVTVDVGSREKVSVGQTVTDGFGLTGRVVAVYPTSAVVLLAADPTFGVGARDSRSGALLLAKGNGSHGMSAGLLDDGTSVKVGDHLVTGPAGDTTFVGGLEIGVVTSVTTSTDGTVKTTVRPTAPQTGLDLLGIVLTGHSDAVRPPIGNGADR